MHRLLAAVVLALAFHLAPVHAQSSGPIVAVGGGGTTPAIVAKTLELAGGRNAIVAVLPQASELPTAGDGSVKMWTEAGAKSVRVVSFDNREAARAILREASLIWMPGGSQSRFMEKIDGTGLAHGGTALAVGADVAILAIGALDGTGSVTVSVRPPFVGTILDRYYVQAITSASGSFIPLTASASLVLRNNDLLAGAIGTPGPEGPTGPAGPAGPQGFTGPVGATGATGLAGPTGPSGIQGAAGLNGSDGPVGATGAPGPPGMTGPMGAPGINGVNGMNGEPGPKGDSGIGFTWRGEFVEGASHRLGDVVSFGGETWIASGFTSGAPPCCGWELLAARGAAGDQGEQGPQGAPGAPGAAGATGPAGVAGPTGPIGLAGPQGPTGANGAAVTVFLETLSRTVLIGGQNIGEANAGIVILKDVPNSATYLARVDAELDTRFSLYFDYFCKLQVFRYPNVVDAPFIDLPGTRRQVGWRMGKDNGNGGSGVSISMQAPVTGGTFGARVRMVCWGVVEPGAPIYDFGQGVTAATLTLVPVGGVQ